jgi:hypothetical protein
MTVRIGPVVAVAAVDPGVVEEFARDGCSCDWSRSLTSRRSGLATIAGAALAPNSMALVPENMLTATWALSRRND